MAFGKSAGDRKRGAHFADGQGSSGREPAGRSLQGSGEARSAVGPDPLEADGDAPRPIGPDAMATGSFEKLDAGQGAVVTTRENASDVADAARSHLSGTAGMMRLDMEVPEADVPKGRTNRRAIALLVVLTAAVILGGAYLFSRLTASAGQQAEEEQQTEQAQTSTSDAIEYRGTTYRLEQSDDGTWHLARQSEDEGAQEQSLGDLPGTPVSLVLYNGAIVVPENKSDGSWDVMVYVLGSGWSQLLQDDGSAYSGQGSISGATLDGSELTLTSDSGVQTIPLDW